MAHLNVTKMSIYHIFGGTSEKLTGQVLTRSSLVSPAICKFFFSFLMCIYLCCAEISTECHHIALWVLCRTQLWGQSGEKGMHGVMLPFILPFSFNIVIFLLSQQFISLCLTFVVPFLPSQQSSSNTLHYIHIEQLDKVSSPSCFHLPSLWNS